MENSPYAKISTHAKLKSHHKKFLIVYINIFIDLEIRGLCLDISLLLRNACSYSY